MTTLLLLPALPTMNVISSLIPRKITIGSGYDKLTEEVGAQLQSER